MKRLFLSIEAAATNLEPGFMWDPRARPLPWMYNVGEHSKYSQEAREQEGLEEGDVCV